MGNSIDDETGAAYTKSLKQHLQYVYEAGEKLGVDKEQIQLHDESKWTPHEFPHYARNFHGDKSDPEGFTRAWLHHIHSNPHHWQHWIFPDKYQMEGGGTHENGAIAMPIQFSKEMCADWMAAGRTYQNSWDISDWLHQNLPKIHPYLHPKTWVDLKDILKKEGYGSVIAKALCTYKPK